MLIISNNIVFTTFLDLVFHSAYWWGDQIVGMIWRDPSVALGITRGHFLFFPLKKVNF